jgi:hypothetical protein
MTTFGSKVDPGTLHRYYISTGAERGVTLPNLILSGKVGERPVGKTAGVHFDQRLADLE